MKQDYFEMDRVIEDLAKTYAAPCATSWFKVSNIKKPLQEEYRKKVVEFMNQLEQTLSDSYPNDVQSEEFKEYVRNGLRKAIYNVNCGDSKELTFHFIKTEQCTFIKAKVLYVEFWYIMLLLTSYQLSKIYFEQDLQYN